MTLDELRAYGAEVDTGLARCMNMEAFYLNLVGQIFDEDRYDELENAIVSKDFMHAFEIAHGLKGIYANLSLTPLLEPISEMVELLRTRTDTDYSGLIGTAREAFEELRQLV